MCTKVNDTTEKVNDEVRKQQEIDANHVKVIMQKSELNDERTIETLPSSDVPVGVNPDITSNPQSQNLIKSELDQYDQSEESKVGSSGTIGDDEFVKPDFAVNNYEIPQEYVFTDQNIAPLFEEYNMKFLANWARTYT